MTNTNNTPKTTDANLAKITEGIAPAFDALKAACLKRLRNQVKIVHAKLKEHGWDFDAAYPYPKAFGMAREEYRAAKSRIATANGFVMDDPNAPRDYRPQAPRKVIMRPDLAKRFDKEATDYARMFIDAYAVKLTGKIEKSFGDFEVESVTYTGSADPFANSRLTVSGPHGTLVWSTKCILNQSIYGKLFNQWPTRLVSHEEPIDIGTDGETNCARCDRDIERGDGYCEECREIEHGHEDPRLQQVDKDLDEIEAAIEKLEKPAPAVSQTELDKIIPIVRAVVNLRPGAKDLDLIGFARDTIEQDIEMTDFTPEQHAQAFDIWIDIDRDVRGE